MVSVQPEQALTLAAIMTEGTFDAAARRLHLTPSAVSQRIRALEMAVGRPVLRRIRPVELTPAGEAVVRFARQLELLSCDLSDQLEPETEGTTPDHPGPGLHSTTTGRDAVPAHLHTGFRRSMVRRRHHQHGTRRRPVVVYDDKDDLRDRYLRRHRRPPCHPPRHYVPATHEFGRAIQLGLGWGKLPEPQLAQLAPGTLTPLGPISTPRRRPLVAAVASHHYRTLSHTRRGNLLRTD